MGLYRIATISCPCQWPAASRPLELISISDLNIFSVVMPYVHRPVRCESLLIPCFHIVARHEQNL